jgi:4-aminobutyrate aminotransferase
MAPVIGFDTDIEVVGSEGSWVIAADGTRYLDFTCGIAVSNLGHQHPMVKQAILDQVDRVWHAGSVFRYETIVAAAERLNSVTPESINKFFFMNSGAEAVEGSIKLARKTSGRQGVIVFRGGFHGRTMGSVSYTTSKAKYRQGYHPLVGSVFVTPFPRPFRWRMSQEEATARALDELNYMFKHEITPGEVAAFLVEPLQGEGGYYPAGATFLLELRRLADEHGILLVVDEVQTGFGRTGDWFTSQVYGVRPDVLVMGKAIANGLPLSAVGASTDLLDKWPPGSHGPRCRSSPIMHSAASMSSASSIARSGKCAASDS